MSQEQEQEQATEGRSTQQRRRPSFSVRLQPYEGALLTEVVTYLNGLERGDAKRQVEDVLVMALLAKARFYDEACSDEERRRCCIEACDALEKHASMLRQLVGVEQPVRAVAAMPAYGAAVVPQQVDSAELVQATHDVESVEERDDDEADTEVRSPPKSRIASKATAADANALFGG